MATSPLPIIFLTLSLIAATASAAAAADRNITDVLKDYPEYSLYNNYLTQTNLADDINRRETVTVLVFNNTIASEYLSNQTLAVIKVALSIHSLLDFFDLPKLHEIGGGNMTTTTLYQTTGTATGSTGFVKVTDLVAGNVGFGSGEGSRLDALFYRSVIQIPYNLSVLEITSPIITPGILKRPLALDLNITSLLEKAGCKTFAKLISETGALKIYETAEARGLTVFAPSDEAFKARGLPDLSDLSNNDFISLLLYHAISGYVPKVSLMTEKNPIKTLASNQILGLGFTVRTVGDSVTLSTGVDDSRVESTILDSVPLSILKIDRVLLPAEFFPKSPARAPVPVPELSPPSPLSPSVPKISPPSPPSPSVPETSPPSPPVPAPAPVKTPIASAPAPVSKTSPVVSPPAPTNTSPVSGPAPAGGPTADAAINNSGSGIKAPVMLLALVIVTVFGIMSSIVG